MAIAKRATEISDFSSESSATELARRLSDKILMAFNHAYAVGEIEMARTLRRLLEKNERARRTDGEGRTGYDPVRRADLWVAFVELRDGYRAACDTGRANTKAAAKALDDMKEAYRRWAET